MSARRLLALLTALGLVVIAADACLCLQTLTRP
jgi:hypothetical protein